MCNLKFYDLLLTFLMRAAISFSSGRATYLSMSAASSNGPLSVVSSTRRYLQIRLKYGSQGHYSTFDLKQR